MVEDRRTLWPQALAVTRDGRGQLAGATGAQRDEGLLL